MTLELQKQINELNRRLKSLENQEQPSISKVNIKSTAVLDDHELTIASGVVTITKGYHTIDTESDASTDDLDTINGGTVGDLLLIRPVNNNRDVVAKNFTGNLSLTGDFTMDTEADMLLLFYDGVQWKEISRSSNAIGVLDLTESDGLTVGESASATLVHNVAGSDGLTVGESVTVSVS